MDYQDSCEASAWQATLPTVVFKLADRWKVSDDASVRSCREGPKKLTTEAIFVMGVILFCVMLNIIGSSINAYESFRKVFPRKKTPRKVKDETNDENREIQAEWKKKSTESSTFSVSRENYRKFFDCFCIQANARKLLGVASKPNCFHSIDGIRAIFFFYIFTAHFVYFYGNSMKNVDKHIYYMMKLPIAKFSAIAIFVIDGFITISGFLLGYLFLNYYEEKNGKIPWIGFYAIRFLKITPVYMILLGAYSTLFTYMSSSPVWPTYDTNPICRKKWIWNLLYINNFDTHYNQCMGMTWFLGCLMQLFVISPLFLVPLKRWPRIGYALSFITICISCFLSFTVTKKYNLIGFIPKLGPSDGTIVLFRQMWLLADKFHQNTLLRLTPFIVGILLGCYLHKRKLTKKDNMLTLAFGWILSAILMYFAVFALINRDESAWEAAVYNGVKDLLFSCSFSWIIFVCITGQGGLLGEFLSHKMFQPLSRLSFCGYLTQTFVLEGYFLSVEVLANEAIIYQGLLSDLSWVFLLFRLFLWTQVLAFVVSVLLEYPVKHLLHTYAAK